MQSHQDRPDYPTANGPSPASTLQSGHSDSTAISVLDPYTPPNVPHGLPHVVRFATLSSMDLPLEVRFLIIMIARFADVHGVASVANSTLCEICRIGSHHTVERWISLAADVGILRKEPGRGGKDRRSNTYVFLGKDRGWQPLPVGHPDTNPIVALAHARLVIETLLVKAARVDELEADIDLLRAELALLTNGHTNGHSGVPNGEDEPPAGPPSDSYETADSRSSQDAREPIGHSGVTNGIPGEPPAEASHSHEDPDSDNSPGTYGAISHSVVTNGSSDNPPAEASHSYENRRFRNHPGGPWAHWSLRSDQWATVAGPDEGQDYLARRARVEELVMAHGAYYRRSFSRRGLPGAVEYFSRSDETRTGVAPPGAHPGGRRGPPAGGHRPARTG